MANEKKDLSLKAKLAILIFCPLIVIGLCIGAILVTVDTIVDADTYSFDDAEKTEIKLPSGTADTVAFVTEKTDAVKQANDVKSDRSVNISLSDIQGTLTDAQASVLDYFRSSVEESLKQAYTAETADYGTVRPENLLKTDAGDITEATAEANEEGTKIRFSLSCAEGENALAAFYKQTDEAAGKTAEAASTEECRLSVDSVKAGDITITGECDVKTGRLTNISTERKYDADVTLAFSGSLAGLGTQQLKLVYTVKETEKYSYAGIFIKEDKISIGSKDMKQLSVSANLAENTDNDSFKLTFTSSDESVALVDADGRVTGVPGGEGNVTVTATLEYLGNTYTDTCSVFVGVPVEKVSVSPRKHTLKTGETFAFEPEITPADATVKTVTWISENEDICSIDENGSVTGLKPGSTRIIAVTADGNFMSAADVIVEGGENGE